MAVLVDKVGQNLRSGTGVTTFTYTMGGAGVGAGANALTVVIAASGAAAQAVGMTATWNGVTMPNLVNTNTASTNNGTIWIFGLRNPVSGNQNLVLNWTGANQVSVAAISFSGVDTTSDLTAFPNQPLPSVGGPGSLSLVIPSVVGNMTLSGVSCPTSLTTPNQTQLFLDTGTPDPGGGQYAVGAANVTHSWTLGAFGAIVGTDIGAMVTFQPRAPFLSKLFSWPRAPAFQPYNLALYSVAVVQIPFVQTNWSKPFVAPQLPQQAVPYNVNIFTNPIPFGPFDYGDGAFRVPPFRPDTTQPLNPNLFTNPIPFSKSDWFPVGQPPNAPPQAVPYNVNIFTNPIPFAQFMWTDPFGVGLPPPQAVPYNVNIFTNPIPFAQFDWNHPVFPPPYFPPPVQALNLQLFTNPIPFFNFISQPPAALPFFASSIPYNVPLYTVTVTAAPFAQYDWPIVRMPRPQRDVTQPLNPNIFTNPFPFTPIDYSAITPRIPRAPDQAYYNLNVYTVVVTAAPFVPIDYSKPFFPRVLPLNPLSVNIQLFTNPIPFFQTDWSTTRFQTPRAPDASQSTGINLLPDPTLMMLVSWFGSASSLRPNLPDQQPYNQSLYSGVVVQSPFVPIDWSKPFFPRVLLLDPQSVNIQLFTNPIPFFNLDLKGVNKPAGTPDLSVPYNVNLYGVVTVVPFAQYDWSKPLPVRPVLVPVQAYNVNIFTNPIPFAQYYWPLQFNVLQAQLNRSVQTNINLFTNPIPFVQNQYPGQRPVRIGLIHIPPYNQNLYSVTPAPGQNLHVVKFIGNMGHFMIR